MKKLRRLYLLHDLLPWEDDLPGRTAAELVVLLGRAGFSCTKRTVERDLQELAAIAMLEWERDGNGLRWKRFHPTRLTDALLGEGSDRSEASPS